jgi:hypothetical protein
VNVYGHLDDGTVDICDDAECLAAVTRGDRWIGAFLSVEPGGRAHFHHSSELHAHVRAHHDDQFRQTAAAYDNNPTDFVTAWTYLMNHPMFHRPGYGVRSGATMDELSSEQLAAPPDHIDDSNGLQDLWMHVSRDDGRVAVYLEHGPHLWPHDVPSTEHRNFPADGMSSHDIDLDVCAATYEDAIVRLAANVRGKYGHDRSNIALWDQTCIDTETP